MSDTNSLLRVLPDSLQSIVRTALGAAPEELAEIVLDDGSPLEIRRSSGERVRVDRLITPDEIAFVVSQVGSFGPDNRAGIDRTLHRISKIVARDGQTIVGLTLRCGRPIAGAADALLPLLTEGKSILLLGAPGSGKTTKLREACRLLADTLDRRVAIVDTSNEIAGDGKRPHAAVGTSRRLPIPAGRTQEGIMIEAAQNHNPEVIVVDEIAGKAEALAARTIAERGVQLVATAHGRELADLLKNPPLAELMGGISIVTVSDDTAKERGLRSKTVLERETDPSFDVVVEITSFGEVRVHHNAAEAVDLIFKGEDPNPETWTLDTACGKSDAWRADPREALRRLVQNSPLHSSMKEGRDAPSERAAEEPRPRIKPTRPEIKAPREKPGGKDGGGRKRKNQSGPPRRGRRR